MGQNPRTGVGLLDIARCYILGRCPVRISCYHEMVQAEWLERYWQ